MKTLTMLALLLMLGVLAAPAGAVSLGDGEIQAPVTADEPQGS